MSRKAVSGIMLTLLFISMLTLAFSVQPVIASGTIYITADGRVEPDTAPILTVDNVTYAFTDNIHDQIIVERDNIVVDGFGYTLQGTGRFGIHLLGRSNVTIKNLEIKEFRHGIEIHSSRQCVVRCNNITSSGSYGVELRDSEDNIISSNNLTNNGFDALLLWSTHGTAITGNNMSHNQIYGMRARFSNDNVIEGNEIIGNKITGIWFIGDSNNNSITGNIIANHSIFGINLYNSSNNNTISENNIISNKDGILLEDSTANSISGNNISSNGEYGVLVYHSNNCMVFDNLIFNNHMGIGIALSDDNYIEGNSISNNEAGISLGSSGNSNLIQDNDISNNDFGIQVGWSEENTIAANTIILNNYAGVRLDSSSNNNIVGNTMTLNNRDGIVLYGSNNNTIAMNDLIQNKWDGIAVWYSNANLIHHNNFQHNTKQAGSYSGSTNTWDNGYPSGGNYWSDHTGIDVKRGPNQDQPSSDGIGDTEYIIATDNVDHYPLMAPWNAPPPPSYTLTIYSSPTGVTFTVDGISRTTPWSGTYSEGASVSLEMPEVHNRYVWSQWLEDSDPNRIKTVTIDTNITLTAKYQPKGVGGIEIPTNVPTDRPELAIPWPWLSAIILPLFATVVFLKLRKKRRQT